MSKRVSKRALATAAAALTVAGATAAAIAAATGGSLSPSSFFADVARHLGISTEKLQDATKAAALDQVDAALKAGRITQAQADALKSRIQAGDFPPLFGPPQFGDHFFGRHGLFAFGPPDWRFGGFLSSAATYLGLTVDQLVQQLRAGQTLAGIAKAQGRSVEGLEQAIIADAKTHLDELAKKGVVTSAQETAMLDGLKARVDALVNGARHHEFGARIFGPFGGRMFGPFGPSGPGAPPQSTDPRPPQPGIDL